jgi:nitrous oxidase accessory protein
MATEIVVPVGTGELARAIATAQPGDTLRLQPGIHEGSVIIAKPLALTGEESAEVRGPGTGTVITVDAPDVHVSDLTISGSGSSHETLDSGIKLTQKATRARVSNNIVTGNLHGIDIHGARDAQVAGNTITGRRGRRMNERGNGIYVWNAPGAVVEGNTVRYGRDGIFVNTSHHNIFRNNTFSELRFAVHYMHANDSTVSGNVSRNNHLGYALMFSSRLKIEGNTSTGDRDHGIMLNYANDAMVEGNFVQGGGRKCLFMYNANKNVVRGNRFEGCPIGIHFTAGSERNIFSNNAFIANRTQVKYVGSRNHEWSAEGRGNYWSDHVSFDLNGDGVADQAFRPNDRMDEVLWTQPAARWLLGSPAMQLLRWAQREFPALLPGGVVDSAPLMRPHAPAAQEESSVQ